jgi:tetratricopeptide (TPR) repeat protein
MRFLPLALIAVAACGPTVVNEHKGVELTRHLPATLETSRPREGDPRTVKVRVYTDAGIRALPKWKEEISDQLDYANQLLTPMIGARLTVEKWVEWNRTEDPSKALPALVELDKGEGVTWVIGYATAGDVASKAMSELGAAEPLGRHVVVRGWAEKPETAALSARLPDMKGGDAARAEVFSAHRRHKQTVVLLHMLAATLGAIDESDPTWIQNPSYAPKQLTFSDRNRELMQLALDQRVAEATDVELARKLLESIEKTGFGGWVPTSKDEVTKRLRIVIDGTKAGRTASAVPTAAYDQFSRIEGLVKSGKLADALVELDNLLIAYPGNAAMHHLRCEIALAMSGPKPPAPKQPPAKAPPRGAPKAPEPAPAPAIDWKAACKKASDLAQGDPTPHLSVATAYLRTADLRSAREELVLAEGKIANLGSAGEAAWKKLIGIYVGLQALTWADEAIAKAKLDNDPAAAQITQLRTRYGVPKGAKFVTAEREGDLVAAIRAALDLVYAAKYGDAERALAAIDRQWPGAPGSYATRCDLNLRTGAIDGARASCQKALAIHPGNSWALYLSGVIALKTAAGTPQGIDFLKKAIGVDPDLGQAWRTLAKAYARTKDKAAYEQLAKDYQAKFGSPLPP